VSDKITITNMRTGESVEMDASAAIDWAAQQLLLAQLMLGSAKSEVTINENDRTATVTYSWPVEPVTYSLSPMLDRLDTTPPPSTTTPSTPAP